jgi:hypothetical protein
LPPILSVPDLASYFAFNLLIVSRVSSLGVKSLFSPEPEVPAAPPAAGAGVEGLAAGVVLSESDAEVELVEFEELDLFSGAVSLATYFFLTSTSYFLASGTYAGGSSFFLHVVILHQNHARISSTIKNYDCSLISLNADVSTAALALV